MRKRPRRDTHNQDVLEERVVSIGRVEESHELLLDLGILGLVDYLAVGAGCVIDICMHKCHKQTKYDTHIWQ